MTTITNNLRNHNDKMAQLADLKILCPAWFQLWDKLANHEIECECSDICRDLSWVSKTREHEGDVQAALVALFKQGIDRGWDQVANNLPRELSGKPKQVHSGGGACALAYANEILELGHSKGWEDARTFLLEEKTRLRRKILVTEGTAEEVSDEAEAYASHPSRAGSACRKMKGAIKGKLEKLGRKREGFVKLE